MEAYQAEWLPLKNIIDSSAFYNELLEAYAALKVYRSKVEDSKLDSSWFMPLLQQKEALASSVLEGTQATLDDVLINQVEEKRADKDLAAVDNYFLAADEGYHYLQSKPFSIKFIQEIHQNLLKDDPRKNSLEVGVFRSKQNYIARMEKERKGRASVVFVPPVPEQVNPLMDNLVEYMIDPADDLHPLVRTAIIHAQFLTIHPFMDGNGRVGRILIPLYMYATKQIDTPYFFISEALERDQFKYYRYLNEIRSDGKWNEWIRFFLITVKNQCTKYIDMVKEINELYERDLEKARSLLRTNKMDDIINLLYKYPVVTSRMIASETNIPQPTVNRYLRLLVENEILFSDQQQRNRLYIYYDLLNIIRK